MKKFLCAVAVATMMMSCGGASEAGDKANDTTAKATAKVETTIMAAILKTQVMD